MKNHSISLLLLLLLSGPGVASVTLPVLDHHLSVTLEPARHRLEVEDRITLPRAMDRVDLVLHAGLALSTPEDGARLQAIGSQRGSVPLERYRIHFQRPVSRFVVRYAGRIHHPVENGDSRHGGTPGTIGPDGVFLAASSAWFPVIDQHFVTFSMTVDLPPGWRSISQGAALPGDHGWRIGVPQDDIYLIAGPYRRFQRSGQGPLAQVYLRDDDPRLARRYLQATDEYLRLYSDLIGPYPYAKFALVENFWESGYGMPSFTLLGPRVIRLPFILRSSYPHEVLHNWWGNGVYVDYAGGNWSEGLTAYLADHLLKQQRGEGAAYRRDTLQHYASYVDREKDFPLTAFRGNHGEVSQAVGYGRMLMFMHMLRLQLGDQVFLRGLRRFYRDNRFRIAGFDDLQRAFEAVSGDDLSRPFDTWTRRTGAPALKLEQVSVTREADGYLLSGTLRQTQPEPPFPLRIPLYLQTAGDDRPGRHWLTMDGRSERFRIRLGQRPLRLWVDPLFDLFRRLDPGEIPSSLGALFGADDLLLILPAAATADTREAWQRLAGRWQARFPGARVRWDADLKTLPADAAIWILGRENRFAAALRPSLERQGVVLGGREIRIAGQTLDRSDTSLVLTGRRLGQPAGTLGFVDAPSAAAIGRLAAKLPHYNKYSYLLFRGDDARNILKGQWRTTDSALSVRLGDGPDLPPVRIPDHPPLSRE